MRVARLAVLVSLLAPAVSAGARSLPSQAAPSSGPADPQEPPPVTATVTVIGEAPPNRIEVGRDPRHLPASGDVLTSREIEGTLVREPSEVLRSLPGVGFSYYGQGGIPSGPTVRGYTDRNFGQDIAGFVDGIPLNLPGFVSSHGVMELTVLVPMAADRIELLRSPIESRYGDFNRGASLSIVTRSGLAAPMLDLAIGSFGTWRVNGAYGNGLPADRRFTLMSLVDANGTGGYADNQGLVHTKLFNRGGLPLGEGRLDLTALNGWSDWDAPGYLEKSAVAS
jgi:outer membrane cobalamin receptor